MSQLGGGNVRWKPVLLQQAVLCVPKNPRKQLVPHTVGHSLVSSVVVLDALLCANFKHDFLVYGADAEDDFVPAITEKEKIRKIFSYQVF